VLSGYRGFVREFSRTGTGRALWLQVKTGAAHVLRRLRGREAGDPIARFFESYGADGFRMPDAPGAALQARAETCLVCGLCTAECARVGGAPPLDPRDAVVAVARLAIDWTRLGLTPFAIEPDGRTRSARAGTPVAGGADCAGCRACDAVCPAGIPIARIQSWLAERSR